VQNVSIFFDKHGSAEGDFTIHPNASGNYSHIFEYENWGFYDITFTHSSYYSESLYNINVNSDISLPNVTMHGIDPNFIKVTHDENIPAFRNIQDALDYAADIGGGTIRVFPGEYQSFQYGYIEADGNIELVGTDKTTCIINDTDGIYVVFNTMDDISFTIKNFTITGATHCGIYHNEDWAEPGTLIIEDNIITGNGSDTDFDYGAGITCLGKAIIRNNEIVDNINEYNSSDEPNHGGGIYVNSTEDVQILNNTIEGNSSYEGSGIYCTGTGDFLIEGNFFTENFLQEGDNSFNNSPGDCVVMMCYECENVMMKNNIFYENIHFDNGYSLPNYCVYINNCIDVMILNNVIDQNLSIEDGHTGLTGIYLGADDNDYRIHVLKNNIIINNKVGIEADGNCQYNTIINYSNVYNNPPVDNGDNYVGCYPGTGCISVDPELDENFMPIWTAEIKSPCIDTGNPDLDGDLVMWYDDPDDCDPDGSRFDMGAVPAISHKNDAWLLPYLGIDGNWKWISFPSVDDLTDENDTMGSMMLQLTEHNLLDSVIWKSNNDGYVFDWDEIQHHWTNPDHTVTSSQGYKLRMKWDVFDEHALEVSGFLISPNAVIELLGEEIENWIGYILEKSMEAEKAFAGVWDNLISIKTQYWSMWRIPGTDNWISGEDTVLEYGDMVVVTCYEDCDLVWDNDSPPNDPKGRKDAENFDYTEEADYIPVFVELNPEDEPAEIGVYVDGECKGAAVVQSDTVHIRSYMIGDEGELEFIKYYNDRAPLQASPEYLVYNPETHHNERRKIEISENKDFYFVSFNEDNFEDIPLTFNVHNYPNPFNPITTIFYSLPEDSEVKLTIYNIKGQKVRELVNGEHNAGKYQSLWDGKDKNNNSVSSGIYFYRIETNKACLNRKMILMK